MSTDCHRISDLEDVRNEDRPLPSTLRDRFATTETLIMNTISEKSRKRGVVLTNHKVRFDDWYYISTCMMYILFQRAARGSV